VLVWVDGWMGGWVDGGALRDCSDSMIHDCIHSFYASDFVSVCAPEAARLHDAVHTWIR
jgi:hypothetical protein